MKRVLGMDKFRAEGCIFLSNIWTFIEILQNTLEKSSYGKTIEAEGFDQTVAEQCSDTEYHRSIRVLVISMV